MTAAPVDPLDPRDGATETLTPAPIGPVPGAIHLPVMIVGAIGAAVVFWAHRENLLWAVFFAVLVLVAAHLSAIDIYVQRLPNRIVGPLSAATACAVAVFGLIEGDIGRSGQALGLGLATFSVLLLMNLLGGMGMGDVKFGFPLGAALGWLGVDALIQGAMAMVLSGGIVALGVLIRTRSKNSFFAFGPFMTVGLIFALIASGSL